MFVSVNGSYTTPILCMLHPMVVISPIPEIFAFQLLEFTRFELGWDSMTLWRSLKDNIYYIE